MAALVAVVAQIALSSLAILGGCGQPKAKTPPTLKLRAPAFPARRAPQGAQALDLSEWGVNTASYSGSLIIWDPGITERQVATLLRATDDTNRARVALQERFESYVAREVAPLEKAIASRKSMADARAAESDARTFEESLVAARAWFPAALARWGETIDAFHPVDGKPSVLTLHAQKAFERYCEARIWHLAASGTLTDTLFVRRPTPLALCEPVYESKGFFTGALCEPDASGKNYFACVWKEGVFRTEHFHALGRGADADPATDNEAQRDLRALVDQDVFKAALRKKGEGACEFQALARKLLSGEALRVLANGNVFGGWQCVDWANSGAMKRYDFGLYVKDAAGKDVGVKCTDSGCVPERVLKAFEDRARDNVDVTPSTGYPDALRLVPLKFTDLADASGSGTGAGGVEGSSSTYVSAPALDAGFALLEQLRAFVVNLATPASPCEVAKALFVTPHDISFNARLATPREAQLSKCDFVPPSDSPILEIVREDKETANLTTEVLSLKDRLASVRASGKQADHCPVRPSCASAAPGHAACAYERAKARKLAAAADPGVAAVLVRDFTLKPERNANGSVWMEVVFENTLVAQGCVVGPTDPTGPTSDGASAHGKDRGCPQAASVAQGLRAGARPLNARLNAADGILTLSLPVDGALFERASVRPMRTVRGARGGASASAYDAERFAGARLDIELVANGFDGKRPFFHGKAILKRGGKAIAEGVGSYLVEDAVDLRLFDFCVN